MALDERFNRIYIHERAKKVYSMEEIGKKYEYAFKSIMEIHNGNNGWFSERSYIEIVE